MSLYSNAAQFEHALHGLTSPHYPTDGRAALTERVSERDDGTLVQLRPVGGVGENHGQVRPPVAPALVGTALKRAQTGISAVRSGHSGS